MNKIRLLPKRVFVVVQDKYIKWLAIVIQGSVWVWQEKEGRKILLYDVIPLETCSLSLAATFKDYKSLVHARTEHNTTLIKIPLRFVKQWSFEYQSRFRFTTQAFNARYEDLLIFHKSLALIGYKLEVTDTASGKIPKYSIECRADRAIPIWAQWCMYEAKVKKVFILNSSHTTNFSQPDKLAAMLLEVIQ